MKSDSFYITTPIYYVNDKPHIGTSYTTVLADVIARYQRLLDKEVFFLTGTDEHGQKVEKAAEKLGVTPQAHADETVKRFQAMWKRLDITHDDFIRTTEPRHTKIVQAILQELYDKDEIYKAEYDGWYCVPDERFFTEKDLVDGKCPLCGREVERIREANYFFRMSKYQEWLIQYIEENPEFIQPDFRRNETLGFLRKPLNDLCISRPKKRLSWGIELPFDAEYVTYVWFDALVNYISAAGYKSDSDQFEKYWPADFHLIGKDILTTHTVYWPTMLKAMGVPLPKTVFAHGFWLAGDAKMGKSMGNAIDPVFYTEQYGADAFRYFLIAEMSVGQDASFTHDRFVKRYNADLANDLGNLFSRISKLLSSGFDGKLPAGEKELTADAEALWLKGQAIVNGLDEQLGKLRLDLLLADVAALVRDSNKYMEQVQPWKLVKTDKDAAGKCLYFIAELLRVISQLLFPVMPSKMGELQAALGLEAAVSVKTLNNWAVLEPGAEVRATTLFPRIDVEKDKQLFIDLNETDNNKTETAMNTEADNENVGLINFDAFTKVQLKTAKVIDAEKVPETAKLLKLSVMLGEERRQIVAGIALHYEPEDLIGKTVVMVANLEPATIKGVESQGMLLAASKGERLSVITTDRELTSGADIA